MDEDGTGNLQQIFVFIHPHIYKNLFDEKIAFYRRGFSSLLYPFFPRVTAAMPEQLIRSHTIHPRYLFIYRR